MWGRTLILQNLLVSYRTEHWLSPYKGQNQRVKGDLICSLVEQEMGQRCLTSFESWKLYLFSFPNSATEQSPCPRDPKAEMHRDSSCHRTGWVLLLRVLWFFSKTREMTEKGQGDVILLYQPSLSPCARVGETPFYLEIVMFSSSGCPVRMQQNTVLTRLPIIIGIRSTFKMWHWFLCVPQHQR